MIKLFDSNMNEVTIKREMYQWDIFPLDNFSAFGFVMNGEYFQTSEHVFQYLKFVNTNKEIANKKKHHFHLMMQEILLMKIKNIDYLIGQMSSVKIWKKF